VIGEIDPIAPPAEITRVVLCSGKVYYDLLAERRNRGLRDVAILRLEQIYPFPVRVLKDALAPYKNAKIIWCQEEPANMGAWLFVDRRLEQVLGCIGREGMRPCYAGRPDAASPATGQAKKHTAEQAALVASALGVA